MLYFFDPSKRQLDPIEAVEASSVGVREVEIEKALAGRPEALFRRSRMGAPVMVVRTSAPGTEMADVIALDAEGRLVLIECKRGIARRNTLAQLIDYASSYDTDPFRRLEDDWHSGEGSKIQKELVAAFREFADDPAADQNGLAKAHVLVVVAAGRDDEFKRMALYMDKRGVSVHFVSARLFRRSNGELLLEVEPIDLDGHKDEAEGPEAQPAWLINTDESHSPGADARFVQAGVAAIWGYEDGPATLQQGAEAGQRIYAYLNGSGIVAYGAIVDGKVHQAPPGGSVFPEVGENMNEWHLRVDWRSLPKPISAAEVRAQTGSGLPVRNTFCRLWNADVRRFLLRRTR